MAVNKVNKISDNTKIKLKLKSPLLLPNNPSEKGLTPAQIKNTFTAYVLDNEDSVFAEINRLVDEINEILSKIEGKISSSNHSHSNLELLEEYTESNEDIEDAVNKKHKHNNNDILDSYSLKQQELINLIGSGGNSSGSSGSGGTINEETLEALRQEFKEEIQNNYEKSQGEWGEADNNIIAQAETNRKKLQNQIDAINASQNLIDIVGSYEALESYDTTNVKDNDKIGVLIDENNNEVFAYYRWDAVNNVWLLIGSVNAGITLNQALELFATIETLQQINNKLPNKLKAENNKIMLNKDDTNISNISLKTIHGKTIFGEGDLLLVNCIEINSLKALTVTEQLSFKQLLEDLTDSGINYKKACNSVILHKTNEDGEILVDYYLLSSVLTLDDGTICLTFVSTNLTNRVMIEVYSSDEGITWSIEEKQKYINSTDVKFSGGQNLEEVMDTKPDNSSVYNIEQIDDLFDEKQDKCIDQHGSLYINDAPVICNDTESIQIGVETLPMKILSGNKRPTINIKIGDNVVYTKVATLYDLEQIIGSAEETMDTLGELSKAIKDNKDVIESIDAAITNKANKSDVYTKTETLNTQSIEDLIHDSIANNTKIDNAVANSSLALELLKNKSIAYPMYMSDPTEEDKNFLNNNHGSLIFDMDTSFVYAPIYSDNVEQACLVYASVDVYDERVRWYEIDWDSLTSSYSEFYLNEAVPHVEYGTINVHGGNTTRFYTGSSKCVKLVMATNVIDRDMVNVLEIRSGCQQDPITEWSTIISILPSQYINGLVIEILDFTFIIHCSDGSILMPQNYRGAYDDSIAMYLEDDMSSSRIDFSYRLEN